MPLAAIGCAVQLHQSSTKQASWAENLIDGWYLQTSPEHYQCHVPQGYSTISGHRCTFLLAEYSTKESLTLPTFLVLKVPLGVLHDSGTALLSMGMYLLDPLSKKRRTPLEPVSRRTLIVLWFTNSLSLTSSGGRWALFWRVLST